MMAGGAETYARPKAPLTEQTLLSCIDDSVSKNTTREDKITLSGIVMDELGQPFGGVVVKLVQGGLLKGGTVTEDNGTFSMIAKKDDYELEFCAASYKTERLFLDKNSIGENMPVRMELSISELQGLLMITAPLEKRNEHAGKTTIEEEELRRMGY